MVKKCLNGNKKSGFSIMAYSRVIYWGHQELIIHTHKLGFHSNVTLCMRIMNSNGMSGKPDSLTPEPIHMLRHTYNYYVFDVLLEIEDLSTS